MQEDLQQRVLDIRDAIDEWAIPFFDHYTTVDLFCRGFERGDERVIWQEKQYIYVAAAYILTGHPNDAMAVLQSKLGKIGPRRRYAKVFEFIAERTGRWPDAGGRSG